MLDKERSYEIARAHGIPTPPTVPIEDPSGLREALDIIGLPAAIKPRVSHQYTRMG